MNEEIKRSCFTCEYTHLCYVFINVNDSLRKIKVNIDGVEAPGKLMTVYESIANCCLLYKKD